MVVGILRRNKTREEKRAEAAAEQQSEAHSDIIQKRLSAAWGESGIGRSTSRIVHSASTSRMMHGAQLVRQQTVGGAVRLAVAIDMTERSAPPRGLSGQGLDKHDDSLHRARSAAAEGSIEVLVAPDSQELIKHGDQLLIVAEDELKANTI